jgi:hypothetical protein
MELKPLSHNSMTLSLRPTLKLVNEWGVFWHIFTFLFVQLFVSTRYDLNTIQTAPLLRLIFMQQPTCSFKLTFWHRNLTFKF